MYKCKLCNKIFSSKQRLKYHEEKKVCNKIKKKFNCIFCSKIYNSKCTFLRHLNKKHPKKNINNIEDESINECKYCGKIFSRRDSLNRHISRYCKKKDDIDISENRLIEMKNSIIQNVKDNNINTSDLIDKILDMKIRNDKLLKTKTINITNNVQNIHNIQTTNNIIINNFGSENIKNIKEEQILNCINRCYSCIPELFKLIHINTPENRNLYLSSMKDSYLYLYKDNKWEVNDLDKILKYIKDNKRDIMEEYYNKNIGKFGTTKQKNINNMINDYNNGKLDKQYNKRIKMILVSNKEMLKKSYI